MNGLEGIAQHVVVPRHLPQNPRLQLVGGLDAEPEKLLLHPANLDLVGALQRPLDERLQGCRDE